MNYSQRAILAALNAPRPPKEKIGWFIPNSAALIETMRNVRKAGKLCTLEVLPNGPVEFFAEDR